MAGLYIHIPFCHSKCSYCDFYSGLRPTDSRGYIDAVIAELSLRRHEITDPFSTIYLGGGTPSVLPVGELSRLVRAVNNLDDISRVEEFTVEINPEDVSADMLQAYRDMGVNRISMGVQSFDNSMLKIINRRHSAEQVFSAIKLLQYEDWNYSIDLMFGLPGQSTEAWRHDVSQLTDIRPPHFSAYLLSYEPGTRLYAMLQRGKVEEASEQMVAEMQQYITDAAKANGYLHYEISNYALPDRHSRHNSAYWTMTPYLGLGASAHSYDGTLRRINPPDIKRYMAALNRGVTASETDIETPDERFNDYIITGLRTAAGLPLPILRSTFPKEYTTRLLRDAAPLITAGHLTLTADTLSIPEPHWLKADAIMCDLLRV